MAAERRASRTRFVVRGQDLERLREVLRSRLEVQSIAPLRTGDSGAEIPFVVELSKAEGDAKATWELVRESMGSPVEVDPVLEDSRGNSLYPTGLVQVRFKKDVSDSDLEDFARSHRLSVVDRNRYQPAQVSLRPLNPCGAYLPELVRELAGADDVLAAWEVTESSYHRS